MLKAIGKYIDTLPLARLFSQEEDGIDSVVIEVDRYYGTHDLAEFTFVMRGITESGGETETELTKEILENVLHLTWNVNHLFTAEAGELSLDLLAYCYLNPESEQTTPDYLIRYQLPSVQVKGLPDFDRVLEGQSYTNLLVQIHHTIEALGDISAIETTLNTLDHMVKILSASVEEYRTQALALQDAVDAMTPISILTEAEYEALEHPDEDTLYVLT